MGRQGKRKERMEKKTYVEGNIVRKKERKKFIVIMKQKAVDQCYIFTLIGEGNRTVAVHKSSNFPDPAQSPVGRRLVNHGPN